MGPRRMWSVQLVWRYSPPTGRPYYATATWVAMAETEDEAIRRAARTLSRDGDVQRVAAMVSPAYGLTQASETVRRCRLNRWDGIDPSRFTNVVIGD